MSSPRAWDVVHGPDFAGSGWAVMSLAESIRRVGVVAFAVWTGVMAIATPVTAGFGPLPTILAVAFVVLGCAATAALRIPTLLPAALALSYGAALAAFVVAADIDSLLAFATCWLINLASCVMMLAAVRRGSLIAIAGAVFNAIGIVLLLPSWGPGLAVSTIVTQLCIVAAVHFGLLPVIRVARAADAAQVEADDLAREVAIKNAAIRRFTEDARRLHDTAINTLAAIAAGGAAVADHARVRAQSAHDAAVLARIASPVLERSDVAEFAAVFDASGVTVRRLGLDDEALKVLESEMLVARRSALIACAREAITNAAKHSGVDTVFVEIAREGPEVRIVVADEGRGFDRALTRLRGSAESLFARAAEHNITVDIESAPGTGTRVTLATPVLVPDDQEPEGSMHNVDGSNAARWSLDTLAQRSSLVWGAGVTGVGLVLALTGESSEPRAHLVMILCMIASLGIAFAVGRRAVADSFVIVSRWALAALTIAVFIASGAAVDFGSTSAVHWQSLAPTAPFVALLGTLPGRRVRLAAGLVWTLAIVSVSGLAAMHYGFTPAAIVLASGLVGIGFGIAWTEFQRLIGGFAAETARLQAATFRSHVDQDVRDAAIETHRRWAEAEVERAASLLRRIARGELVPDAPQTQTRCAIEERYLRQLISVNPEHVQIGPLVSMVLAQMRRGVAVRLTLGDRDLADEVVAAHVMGSVRVALRSLGPHDELDVSVFPIDGGVQLTMKSGAGHLDSVLHELPELHGSLMRLGANDLVQVEFASHSL